MSASIPGSDPALLAGVAAATGGALALVDPFFRGLTEAAAALAVVAWMPRLAAPSVRAALARTPLRAGILLAAVAAGAMLFLALPPPLDRTGALALGGSVLALSAGVPEAEGRGAP